MEDVRRVKEKKVKDEEKEQMDKKQEQKMKEQRDTGDRREEGGRGGAGFGGVGEVLVRVPCFFFHYRARASTVKNASGKQETPSREITLRYIRM